MTATSDRLVRLLNMVPYFQANPHVTRAKAAADLGVSLKQLDADVQQLFVCGLPGYYPDDLIDFLFDGDCIQVTFSAGIDHPLRLTAAEATGLLMALRTLADIPGVVDPAAARSAIAKVEAAVGAAGAGGAEQPDPAEDGAAAAAVRAAVRDRRALALDYYSASRDTLSHRVVDPIRVVLVGVHSYLEAWCRDADGVRLFRFDRIVGAEPLDEPAAAPATTAGADFALFRGESTLPAATLRVAPSAAWLFEYYPMRELRELPGGGWEAELTYASDEWLTRLLLGLGGQVQVLGPAPVAERVREAAEAALAAYRAAAPVASAEKSGGDQ